ncbi:hypothetical protein DPMN_185083 [Dreissena polymorpha]|uniref:Secreted protein n=1 Tax=Dreissena polymorpha TaxID=45954 RepID=A0A9D4DKR2_DREPO|nr:hypothetical protein DPMN_185083 [Dreissena polymorpha]
MVTLLMTVSRVSLACTARATVTCGPLGTAPLGTTVPTGPTPQGHYICPQSREVDARLAHSAPPEQVTPTIALWECTAVRRNSMRRRVSATGDTIVQEVQRARRRLNVRWATSAPMVRASRRLAGTGRTGPSRGSRLRRSVYCATEDITAMALGCLQSLDSVMLGSTAQTVSPSQTRSRTVALLDITALRGQLTRSSAPMVTTRMSTRNTTASCVHLATSVTIQTDQSVTSPTTSVPMAITAQVASTGLTNTPAHQEHITTRRCLLQ